MRNHGGDIQDQDHRAIAHDGGAADHRRGDEFVFEGFDDQFFFAHHAVDGEAETTRAGSDDDDVGARRAFLDLRTTFETFEANQSENLFAQLKNFMVFDLMNVGFGEASDFDDRRNGHGVEAAGDAENKSLNAGGR